MNKVLLIVNAVLLIAVIFLFYREFSTDGPAAPAPAAKSAAAMPVTSKIAFVRLDSLDKNYEYIKEKKQLLERERSKAEATLQAKREAAQGLYMQLSQRAAGMSQAELEQAELQLRGMQQEIEELQFKLGTDLEEKSRRMQQELFDNVQGYLKKYNSGQNFDYIMSYTQGGHILLAKDTLDITDDIVKGLNDDFKKARETKK